MKEPRIRRSAAKELEELAPAPMVLRAALLALNKITGDPRSSGEDLGLFSGSAYVAVVPNAQLLVIYSISDDDTVTIEAIRPNRGLTF
ncbi:hypothetical protein [Streptomyces noursei]